MSDASGSVGASPQSGNGDTPQTQEELINKVIFQRDLDEVLLLIDFVSGRADKNLDDLKLPDTKSEPTPGTQRPNLDPSESIKRIAEIRYPPSPIPRVRAEDAALLLVAKDRLSGLASPARGLTIAYTAIFVAHKPRWRAARIADDRDFRLELAAQAFPAVARHAHWFKWVFQLLVFFSFVWLFLTALTYWDVAMGRSILQRIDQLERDRSTFLQSNPTLSSCSSGSPSTEAVCRRLNQIETGKKEADADLNRFIACAGVGICNQVIHVLRWGFVLCGLDPEKPTANDSQNISSILSVFTVYVLPMMFGLLGTAIGAIRAIQGKVRDSELGPRDLVLTLMGLPIGLVAGVAVGLFFSPTAAPASGSGGLAQELNLTASGLGFLAGYGSDSFFKSLDALLTRVFTARASVPPTPTVKPS